MRGLFANPKETDWVEPVLRSRGVTMGHCLSVLGQPYTYNSASLMRHVDQDSAVLLVQRPLRVYKALRAPTTTDGFLYALASLTLIPGEVVMVQKCNRKARTSALYVNWLRQYTLTDDGDPRPLGGKLPQAYSDHVRSFRYHPGDIITPMHAFDFQALTCASGIHFYFSYDHARHHFN